MDIDHRTVRGFVRAGNFPDRARRGARASLLDAHRMYLDAQVAVGCHNVMQVWRKSPARGLTGERSIVRDAFAIFRWPVASDDSTFIGPQRRRRIVRASE